MIAYRAMVDVPRELAQHLSRLLHAERRRRGTRKNSRALTCFRQAVLGLRWFRQNSEVTARVGVNGSLDLYAFDDLIVGNGQLRVTEVGPGFRSTSLINAINEPG